MTLLDTVAHLRAVPGAGHVQSASWEDLVIAFGNLEKRQRSSGRPATSRTLTATVCIRALPTHCATSHTSTAPVSTS